ncbi:hypothetical protein E3P99_00076 [Wallemia hederae]|uniref:tRNA pseudouridine synthase 1 n=1 Tax=Wallemia hederae TaxID=1540922 RepID=A0A4T0FX55_9BASI|nr:hypothetical protein E3P99_00076 [Wallemia hederae]
MALASYILGFSGVGFATRCWQLAIERRNVFDNFSGHLIAVGAFGTAGYLLHGVSERQQSALEQRKQVLVANREKQQSRLLLAMSNQLKREGSDGVKEAVSATTTTPKTTSSPPQKKQKTQKPNRRQEAVDERKAWTKSWAGLPKASEIAPSDAPKLPKRKCAVIVGFCGTGYNGMQIQSHENTKTIEGDIFMAMVKAGVISADNSTDPGKVNLQRAARTDASVHAASNLISLKIIVDLPDNRDVVEAINEHLPPHIRIWGYVRTQNSFDARTSCDSRSYEYLLPSYVFIPPAPWTVLGKRLGTTDAFWEGVDEKESIESMMQRKRAWRIPQHTLDKARDTLQHFSGSHNFWSYTIGKGYNERSAQRFMKELSIKDPFLVEGNEWISVRFYGQSFMLHQIRKMIFMLVNVTRTPTPPTLIDRTYSSTPIVVPKAPGLGLLLEAPFFNVYNKRVQENNEHVEKGLEDRVKKAIEKAHKQQSKEKEANEEGKEAKKWPTDEEIRQETLKQAIGDKREKIDFEQYHDKIEEFKHKHIYTRLRHEEVSGNVYSKWTGTIDTHDGEQLDYLNAEGVIPDSAVKSGRKGLKGGQNASLDGADVKSETKTETQPQPHATLDDSDNEESYDKKALKSAKAYGKRVPSQLQSTWDTQVLPRVYAVVQDTYALLSKPSLETVVPLAISIVLIYATVISLYNTAKFVIRTAIFIMKWTVIVGVVVAIIQLSSRYTGKDVSSIVTASTPSLLSLFYDSKSSKKKKSPPRHTSYSGYSSSPKRKTKKTKEDVNELINTLNAFYFSCSSTLIFSFFYQTMLVGGIELDDKVVYTIAGLGVALGLYASTHMRTASDIVTQPTAAKNKKGGNKKKGKKEVTDGAGGAGAATATAKKQKQKQKQPEKQQAQPQPQTQPTKKNKAAEPTQTTSKKNKQPPTNTPAKLSVPEFNDVDAGEWTTISKKKAATPTTEKAALLEEADSQQTHQSNKDTATHSETPSQPQTDAWERHAAVPATAALDAHSGIYHDGDWSWSEKNNGDTTTNANVKSINAPLAESTLLKTHNQISVDDMIDTAIQPSSAQPRVMRITKEAKHASAADDGWTMAGAGSKKSVVRDETAAPPPQPQQPSQEEQTKKQRQNAKKKEAKAALKDLNEKQRQETLQKHRQNQSGVMKTSSKNPWEVLARRGDSDLIWD